MTPASPLSRAAEHADWGQVVLNGGPPCFHVDPDGRFCFRAERWFGHHASEPDHQFVSLAALLAPERETPVSEDAARDARVDAAVAYAAGAEAGRTYAERETPADLTALVLEWQEAYRNADRDTPRWIRLEVATDALLAWTPPAAPQDAAPAPPVAEPTVPELEHGDVVVMGGTKHIVYEPEFWRGDEAKIESVKRNGVIIWRREGRTP